MRRLLRNARLGLPDRRRAKFARLLHWRDGSGGLDDLPELVVLLPDRQER